ncbi:unnamed protein product [Boreogadus saida]
MVTPPLNQTVSDKESWAHLCSLPAQELPQTPGGLPRGALVFIEVPLPLDYLSCCSCVRWFARMEESVSVASLARPGQFDHLGEVCCYGPGRYGTDANEPTHARLRNLSWMTYSPCDNHGHNNGDEASFPLNGCRSPGLQLDPTRAFCASAPTLWNLLPLHIRCATSVESFKKLLKAHLFLEAYGL